MNAKSDRAASRIIDAGRQPLSASLSRDADRAPGPASKWSRPWILFVATVTAPIYLCFLLAGLLSLILVRKFTLE